MQADLFRSPDFHFFIRLDRSRMLEGEAVVTDSGDCFHLKASITSFPQKRERAIEELRGLFLP
jgi:RNA binding exosome subunit